MMHGQKNIKLNLDGFYCRSETFEK